MVKKEVVQEQPKSGPTRIQKLLAQMGVGSRRTIETWITEGKIQVNGKTAQLGQMVTARDKIQVAGKLIRVKDPIVKTTRVLIYHKPEGEICSHSSSEGKPSVFTNLPPLEEDKWVMVGRLDVNTAGLLLFTNNGELAHHLMHPRFQIERQYAVRVLGKVTNEMLTRLQQGVLLGDSKSYFKDLTYQGGEGANQWYHVTLTQGKYREVRELWASQGCMVSRLIRIKYGNIALPRDLKKGQFRELPSSQVQKMISTYKV